MELTVRNVRLSSADIKRIYLEAFPPEERMPFPLMVAMSKLWNTEFWGFYDNGLPCGLIYLATGRDTVFVMFLAVDRPLRSKGYGRAILRQMRARYPDKKMIVSIEPCSGNSPGLALRKRRKAFYLRNGYAETGYQMRLGGVEQEILIANGSFSTREFRLFLALYSFGAACPRIWRVG